MRFQFAAFADEAGSGLNEQIAAMKENGISLLEIRGVDGQNISQLTEKQAAEVRKRLDDAGISVWSLGSPYGKISIEEDFAPHLEQFCRGLELAHILGAEHIRLFSFYLPGGKEPEAFFEETVRRLSQFVEKAKDSGVLLCHENEKGIYGDTAVRCRQLHEALPELRAVFDPANFIQCGQDTKAAWELLAPYVEYMHIKDALPNGTVVPAGKGCGNLPWLLKQYSGTVLTLEPHLSVFKGLAQLEREDAKTQIPPYCYPSGRAAFDAAVSALREILPAAETEC